MSQPTALGHPFLFLCLSLLAAILLLGSCGGQPVLPPDGGEQKESADAKGEESHRQEPHQPEKTVEEPTQDRDGSEGQQEQPQEVFELPEADGGSVAEKAPEEVREEGADEGPDSPSNATITTAVGSSLLTASNRLAYGLAYNPYTSPHRLYVADEADNKIYTYAIESGRLRYLAKEMLRPLAP